MAKLTQEDFIQRCKKKHNNYYGYHNLVYVRLLDKVVVTCPIHGDYIVIAANHLRGDRCTHCARKITSSMRTLKFEDFLEKSLESHGGLCNIYLIRCYNEVEDFYKVGITVNGLNQRFRTDLAMPYSYQTVFFKQGKVEDIVELETEIHHKVRTFRYTPKIQFGGSVKECFTKGGLESTISMLNEFKEFNIGTS